MQQRGRERRERDQAEQDEGRARRQEIVERVGGVDVGKGDHGAGRRQDARNMRRRQAGNPGKLFSPPRPFAGNDQRDRQQRPERDPHAGAKQPLLDRVAHEKDAAERDCDAADPDRPLRAEPFLEAHRRRRGRGLRRRCGRGRGCRRRWGDRRDGGDGRLGFGRRATGIAGSAGRFRQPGAQAWTSAPARPRSASSRPRPSVRAVASRASRRRNWSPSPTAFTSATIAMIGNASSNSTSRMTSASIRTHPSQRVRQSIEAMMGTKGSAPAARRGNSRRG